MQRAARKGTNRDGSEAKERGEFGERKGDRIEQRGLSEENGHM
jgi:hypothetical protein